MSTFLKKVALFLLPIILCFFMLELAIRAIPNDYSYKKDYIENNNKDIEVLILGSSHTYYAVNPQFIEKNTFNLSHIAQTIEFDSQLYHKYVESLTNLEILIITTDYLTLYQRLEDSPDKWRRKNYYLYYDLNKFIPLSNKFEITSLPLETNLYRFFKHYVKKESSITSSKKGYGSDERDQKDLSITGQVAALRHTHSSKNLIRNQQILSNMIEDALSKNISVILLSTPAYKTYYKNLDSLQYSNTLNFIEGLENKYESVTFINLLKDNRFTEVDFRDADHLNKNGAKKLSVLLNNEINKIALEK